MTTESLNPNSTNLDLLTPLELVRLMQREDSAVPAAVAREEEAIARAITIIADRLRRGGRLVYIGAGTSGRLGVLDASECPPTFRSPPEQVIGVIAGGTEALTRAIEGAEDNREQGAVDLAERHVGPLDVVVGIATSGRTPYVLGGLEYARSQGAFAIGLACNADSQLVAVSDLMITPIVGPEILAGSTRLKAGTATKLVLNMLSTGAMVQLGKTFGNRMVDLRATNSKLTERSRRMVMDLTGLDAGRAQELLDRCDGEVKTAVLAARCQLAPAAARAQLAQVGGRLRAALEACGGDPEPQAKTSNAHTPNDRCNESEATD